MIDDLDPLEVSPARTAIHTLMGITVGYVNPSANLIDHRWA